MTAVEFFSNFWFYLLLIVGWCLKWYLIGVLVAIPLLKFWNKYSEDKGAWICIFLSWALAIGALIYFLFEILPKWKDKMIDRLTKKIISKYKEFSQGQLNQKINKWFNN